MMQITPPIAIFKMLMITIITLTIITMIIVIMTVSTMIMVTLKPGKPFQIQQNISFHPGSHLSAPASLHPLQAIMIINN